MTTNTTQALASLLPTLNGILPAELVQLSASLLAQSLSRASNLKPEEEIARPYACAEIACQRLRGPLKLPAPHGRPPCAPRVYKKLLTFLAGTLPARPPKRSADGIEKGSGSKAASSPVKVTTTPTKNAARSTLSTPTTTPRKKVGFAGRILDRSSNDAGGSPEAPAWVMPLIRLLCVTFSTPLLPPHVYTGVCVVLKLSGVYPSAEQQAPSFRKQVSALTIALYFMVLVKMRRGEMTSKVYMSRAEKALEVAGLAGAHGDADGRDEADVRKNEVDDWIRKINEEGWSRDQEWWSSVPESVFDEVEDEIAGSAREDEDGDVLTDRRRKRRKGREATDAHAQEDPEGVLLPGLGTMMQDAVDWLSEERKLDYLDWKEVMIGRIRRLEHGRGGAIAAN